MGEVTEATFGLRSGARQAIAGLRRGGLAHLGKEAFRRLVMLGEYELLRRRGLPKVDLGDQTIVPLVHPYNLTWRNERAIEVPLSRDFLTTERRPCLEVGNVLTHYGILADVVVDKYEVAPGVINLDALVFTSAEPFRSILCISTLEHIGFDEDTYGGSTASGGEIAPTVAHLRSLLTEDGEMLVTCPLGLNPELDLLVASDELKPVSERFLKRTKPGVWKEVGREIALDHPVYLGGPDGRGGSVLWIARFSR